MTPEELLEWQDPGLPFRQYWERHVWGPPDSERSQQCINQGLVREGLRYEVYTGKNPYADYKDDQWRTWDAIIASGKSYMVGDQVPTEQFLRTHRRALNGWQRIAFKWCMLHPEQQLELRSRRDQGFAKRIYEVKRRGEYVEISLPHHGAGGEKHWVTKDGRSKILINVD